VLKLNYRNTAEVLALAVHCAHSLLDGSAAAAAAAGHPGSPAEAASDDQLRLVWPASAGRRGPLPVLLQARHGTDEARLLGERIAAALAAGVPAGEIGVLCRAKYLLRPLEQALTQQGVAFQSMNSTGFRRFDWRSDAVRLLTLHSAKGLEFSLCCVAGLQALPMAGESLDDALRLVYVAMTRARQQLVLSAHGESPIVARIRQALGAVQQQFGALDAPVSQF
jgi:superfamily I DNA/RNA helicase